VPTTPLVLPLALVGDGVGRLAVLRLLALDDARRLAVLERFDPLLDAREEPLADREEPLADRVAEVPLRAATVLLPDAFLAELLDRFAPLLLAELLDRFAPLLLALPAISIPLSARRVLQVAYPFARNRTHSGYS
jgi:hypothetical protein